MSAILDVWIARPGDACNVDDHAWTVHVADAESAPYRWAATDYSSLPAPQAHWAGAIPPGCYVVHATLDADPQVSTDHAIVSVDCDGTACVRLYVPGKHRQPPGDDCAIEITDVTATGDGAIETVEVAGTATGCAEIEVSVSCRQGAEQTATATVAADGTWAVTLTGLRRLECKCGGEVLVTAACRANPKCRAQWHDRLKCTSSERG